MVFAKLFALLGASCWCSRDVVAGEGFESFAFYWSGGGGVCETAVDRVFCF